MERLRAIFETRANISATLFIVALIVLLARASMLLPGQYYFSFSGFLFAGDPAVSELFIELSPEDRASWASEMEDRTTVLSQSWIGLVFKLMIPVAAGLLAGLLWREDEIVPAARLGGFAAALLMTWPALMYWELLVAPQLLPRENVFLVMYALYWASYSYLAGAGAGFARVLARNVRTEVKLGDALINTLYGAVAAAISAGAGYAFGG